MTKVAEVFDSLTNILTFLFFAYNFQQKNPKNFKFSIPLRTITVILLSIADCSTKKLLELSSYFTGVKIAIRASYLILQFNICLKLDKLVTWNWSSLFWPFWILSAVYFGAVVLSFMGLLTKVLPVLCSCQTKVKQEAAVYLWICSNVGGLAVFSIVVFFGVESSLEISKISPILVNACKIASIISTFLLLYGAIIRKILIDFFMGIKESEIEENRGEQRARFGRPRGRPRERSERDVFRQRKKTLMEKSRQLEIPKYLLQMGGAFFQKASPQEVFFKEMEKKKERIKQMEKMKSLKTFRNRGKKGHKFVKRIKKDKDGEVVGSSKNLLEVEGEGNGRTKAELSKEVIMPAKKAGVLKKKRIKNGKKNANKKNGSGTKNLKKSSSKKKSKGKNSIFSKESSIKPSNISADMRSVQSE